MKKKAYEQPQFNVIEVEQADIIATSTQTYSNPAFSEYDEITL